MTFDENGRAVFTDQERTSIAAEHDRIAARLWASVERLEKAGNLSQADRFRAQACDAEDLANAARTSSNALARLY
ncbi:hypothetical protein ACFWOJ_18895 [Streptomyces sp. NPDC058439]|uniref:hypothetical protein n=1 Tax=Streptomyces sp. NPDC058439 TaxID=3346500 RepID=UPI0036509A7D